MYSPSSRVLITWAVPVDIMQLGPAFAAHVELSPKLQMLRLCNRFGQGPKAAISKLPVELVHEIESYMVEDMRQLHIAAWEDKYDCFRNLCEPADHYDEDEIFDMWADLHECHGGCEGFYPEDWDEDEDLEEDCGNVDEEEMREFVNVELSDQRDDDDYGRGPEWERRHKRAMEAWIKLTGRPGSDKRGIFAKHEVMLKNTFGLEVWTTHVQPSTGYFRRSDGSDPRLTKAYLCLPGGLEGYSGFSIDSHEEWSEEHGPFNADHPCEHGSEKEVAFPAPPSKESLARFARAAKILGLSAASGNATDKPKDRETSDGDKGLSESKMGCHDTVAFEPKQMMLISGGKDSWTWDIEEDDGYW